MQILLSSVVVVQNWQQKQFMERSEVEIYHSGNYLAGLGFSSLMVHQVLYMLQVLRHSVS